MQPVGSTVYSNARMSFWTRPHSRVLTWPLLLGLLLLLLAAGAIALVHHLNPVRPRLHRVPAIH
ncbi:MAG TPA: hypothetical protein VMF64_06660 [Steroidobacteraceae bacterium]|nr:hypothetical protein [Steroidobacteraceae bacterium]